MTVLAHDRPFLRSVGDEPLPGYRLIAPLGQGGFGEVWKCIAPGGLQKAIKFVLEEADERADSSESSFRQEYEAFLQVKGIRHPFLLTLERVELIRDELIMVMELADESLAQRYEACRASGRPGIDRRQLLAYMVDIAEALDVLSGQHGLQHLDIKPANLFLLGGHVKVGDYGLVARYKKGGDGLEPRLGRGLTPKFVAPEILSDRVDSRTDQYSLALVYFELLTGEFPYPGKSAQQLILQHASAEPNLRALPASDRVAVAQALRKSPSERFPTCLDFVKALLENDNRTSGTTQFTTALTRRNPILPTGQTPYPLQMPRGRVSGSVEALSTQRLNPTMTMRPGGGGALATEELALVCPDLTYAGEGKPGPRGRLIKAVDANGKMKAVRILRLDGGTAADLDDLYRILTRPLPGVAQTVDFPQPRLFAVVWDAEASTLRDWLTAAPPDPPSRATVVRVLEPLGPLLDRLHGDTGFPHLLLTASAITMSHETAKAVTGFGVGEALRRSRTDTDWITDHPTAAPEALAGRPTPASDQFALALLYLELRRAWSADLPRDRSGTPRINWDSLPKDERTVVARALATSPTERYESCAAFMAALRPTATGVILDKVQLIESVAKLDGDAPPTDPAPEPTAFVLAVVRAALAGAVKVSPARMVAPVLREADGRYSQRFPIRLSGPLAALKLSAFTSQHDYQTIPIREGSVLLKPRVGRGSVELVIELPSDGPVTVSEMTVYGRFTGLDQGPKAAETVVAALETFRRGIQNAEDRRKAIRWRTDTGVSLYPVDDELAVGQPITGRMRDVSATGFAAILPGNAPAGHVFVTFDVEGAARGWAALARIVRTVKSTPGETLVAGKFLFTGC